MKKAKTAATALTRRTPVAQQIKAVRAADNLENVIAGIGTDRDKRSYSGYAIPRILTRFELENMYRSSWLSKRIVNTVADDMTREWRDFEFSDADTNPNIEALQDAEKKFSVQTKFNEALRWARLYGGSCIILGMKDTLNAKDLGKPLKVEAVKKDDLKYLHVVDRWRFAPSGKLTTDLTSPNFGKPDSYILADSSVVIHHSRIIRFDGQKLPYFAWLSTGMWDDSELQHVFDSIVNYDTVSAAMASMLFEANIDVVQSENLTQLLGTKDGESKLIRRFQMGQMMKSFNRTLLLDTTEKYEKKQNQFSSLDKVWEQFMVDVCGATEIPMTRLFGQSPAGLNSTGDGDLENYYSMVGAKQQRELRPKLDYFDQVFVRSVIGAYPEDYDYKFKSLWEIDDAERATIDYNNAQRDQIYLGAGVVSEGLVASELKARGVYRTMDDSDVKMAEELGQTMDDFQEEQRGQQLEQTDVNIKNAKSGANQPPNKKKEKPNAKK